MSQDGDKFEFKTLSTFRNYELGFTVGVEFDEFTKGLDNRNVKVSLSHTCKVVQVTSQVIAGVSSSHFVCCLYDNEDAVITVRSGQGTSIRDENRCNKQKIKATM